jgi:hypothetical protein
MLRSRLLLLATPLLALALPALAQNPPAAPPGPPCAGDRPCIRGTVEKLDGQTLTVKSRDGRQLTVALAANFVVAAVVKKSLADVKVGDFVASTSVKGTDGKLHAVEVHILPEALRATAEGQFPWDLVPDGIMTNATVAGIASAAQGQVLKVSYKGNDTEVVVPPDVPVVGYGPGDAGLLKPGAAIFILASKKDDGTLSAARVTAEKDGVKPPM